MSSSPATSPTNTAVSPSKRQVKADKAKLLEKDISFYYEQSKVFKDALNNLLRLQADLILKPQGFKIHYITDAGAVNLADYTVADLAEDAKSMVRYVREMALRLRDCHSFVKKYTHPRNIRTDRRTGFENPIFITEKLANFFRLVYMDTIELPVSTQEITGTNTNIPRGTINLKLQQVVPQIYPFYARLNRVLDYGNTTTTQPLYIGFSSPQGEPNVDENGQLTGSVTGAITGTNGEQIAINIVPNPYYRFTTRADGGVGGLFYFLRKMNGLTSTLPKEGNYVDMTKDPNIHRLFRTTFERELTEMAREDREFNAELERRILNGTAGTNERPRPEFNPDKFRFVRFASITALNALNEKAIRNASRAVNGGQGQQMTAELTDATAEAERKGFTAPEILAINQVIVDADHYAEISSQLTAVKEVIRDLKQSQKQQQLEDQAYATAENPIAAQASIAPQFTAALQQQSGATNTIPFQPIAISPRTRAAQQQSGVQYNQGQSGTVDQFGSGNSLQTAATTDLRDLSGTQGTQLNGFGQPASSQ